MSEEVPPVVNLVQEKEGEEEETAQLQELSIPELMSGVATAKVSVAAAASPSKRKAEEKEEKEEEEEEEEKKVVEKKEEKPKKKRKARQVKPLSGVVALVIAEKDSQEAEALRTKLQQLGAKSLKRMGKTLTHAVWMEGGNQGLLAKAAAAEAAVCVTPAWVEACEAQKVKVEPQEAHLVPAATLEAAKAAKETKKRKASTPKKPAVQELPRDPETKEVIVPVILENGTTLHSLGVVLAEEGFFSTHFVYPVGFKTESSRRSYMFPAKEVLYSFEITRNEESGKPEFRIVCPHDADKPVVAESAAAAVNEVLKRLAGGATVPPLSEEEAAEWFGLANPTVRALVQELPGVDQCQGFLKHDVAKMKRRKRPKVSEEERAAIKARKAAAKAEKEKAKEKTAEEREAKRAAKEAKKQEKEKAAAAKQARLAKEKAAEAKSQNFMMSFVVAKKEPVRKDETIVAPVLPKREASLDMSAFDAELQAQAKPLAECLAEARSKCSTFPKKREPRIKMFKYQDDYFRPLVSYLWRGLKPEDAGKVNGRRPFTEYDDVEYEYDGDEEWEGWDKEEDDVEDLEDAADDVPQDGDQDLEEGEENFIVPDSMVIMEDESVIRGVGGRGSGKGFGAQAVIVPPVLGSPEQVPPELQARASEVMALFELPVDHTKVTAVPKKKSKKKRKVEPSTDKSEKKKKKTPAKKKKKAEELDQDALKETIRKTPGVGLDKIVEAFVASEAGEGHPKTRVKGLIKELAVKDGRGWVVKGEGGAQQTTLQQTTLSPAVVSNE